MEFLSKHSDIIIELAIVLACVWVFFKLVDFVDKKVKANPLNTNLARFMPITTRVIKILGLFVAVAIVMQKHGYSATSLIAGLGVTGLAVGLAAKETLANFFGSFALLSDFTYEVGDYIILEQSINGDTIEGAVEEINLRSTKVRTLDDGLVIIPNAIIANGAVKNMKKANKRRISEYFDITYDTSNEKISQAVEILKQIAQEHEDVYEDYLVFVDTLAEHCIKIRFIAYVKTPEFAKLAKVKSEILAQAIRRFRDENIEFAFPTKTVYVKKDEN